MHLSRCCTPCPIREMREGQMCTRDCGCMWVAVTLVAMVRIQEKKKKLLSESPSCSSLHPSWTGIPWPLFSGVDCPSTPPQHSNVWPLKTNWSRPKSPLPTQTPETQRCGCAHPSEGPVWLAACPAIDCVSQREQSRRQTPDPQESCVRREAAEHRRWAFALKTHPTPLSCDWSTDGESERKKWCIATNAHLQKNKEESLTSHEKTPSTLSPLLSFTNIKKSVLKDKCVHCEIVFLHHDSPTETLRASQRVGLWGGHG